MTAPRLRVAVAVWRLLLVAQFREHPGRLWVTVVAIALGVALGAAVFLVNHAALDEFGIATKRMVGEADIIVRGARSGFPEALYVDLARRPDIALASPVLEVEAALSGRKETLKIIGVDVFRAAALQPELLADIATKVSELFQGNGVFLSSSAAQQLQVRSGERIDVTVGGEDKSLRVLGILAAATYPQPLGVMDIASAQWLFGRVGRVNRIDLRVKSGVSLDALRDELRQRLPPGVVAVAPQVERDRAVTVTRAYRVNLNMLALVALWTGAFLVFSTQSLAVLRRRKALGLLRALGVKRDELQWALVGEGAALGVMGSVLGVALGIVLASALLQLLAGDLGNGQLRTVGASLPTAAAPLGGFFLVGVAVAAVGAWLPARTAARQAPAVSLKGGDSDALVAPGASWRAGLMLVVTGTLLARAPPLAGLPILGYLAIGALLFGAVLVVPILTVQLLKLAPRGLPIILNTAVAQLRQNVGLSTLSLASIIVSFSLMVAMAIMVYSFRVSFENWLGKVLPADLQMREPLGNDTAFWSPAQQAAFAATPGIARIEFRRTLPLLLDASRPAVALIVRGSDAAHAALELPLLQQAPPSTRGAAPPAWISEALQDLYGLKVGDNLTLPLAAHNVEFTVAGVWRDYARTFGAVVVAWPDYAAATGDRDAAEASIRLEPGANATHVIAALTAATGRHPPEITTSGTIRQRSLQIFDRAFAITYALEAIAVIIGLTGVSFAASSTALARRAEFGMLRHLGMLRRQVIGLLATEGLLLTAFGVLYGLGLGGALSLILVYVVNRQSFNWSIDLAVPVWQLGVLSATLIGAAALTAIWSGRAATSTESIRAVREDW